jgi:glutathione S-transferase
VARTARPVDYRRAAANGKAAGRFAPGQENYAMKLYYSPGVCSLSPHIVLREAGAAFELERVDLKTKTTRSGADFTAINAKGYVPALQLDNGEVLTEGPAIVQYIADLHPGAGLAPPPATLARARLQEWLNFISSELHKGFSPLFNPKAPPEYKALALESLTRRFDWLDHQLAGKPYLMGERFTVADAYCFTVLTWTRPAKIDLARWPNLAAYVERVRQRPKVREATVAEGLVKA